MDEIFASRLQCQNTLAYFWCTIKNIFYKHRLEGNFIYTLANVESRRVVQGFGYEIGAANISFLVQNDTKFPFCSLEN